jgi:hypothetical protein
MYLYDQIVTYQTPFQFLRTNQKLDDMVRLELVFETGAQIRFGVN